MLLSRLWSHLKKERKRQFFVIMVLMFVSGMMEVISLGAIVPFLGVLIAPDKVLEYPIVFELVSIIGVESSGDLVLPFTILFASAAVIAAIIRLNLLWTNIRFSHACSADLSTKVYNKTLYQPYQRHIARNSSELISGIKKVESAQTMLQSSLTLGNSFVMILFIMITLLLINEIIAIIALISFGVIYGAIILLSRKILVYNSQHIASESTNVIRSLQEGLGGIRDILLDGTQKFYYNLFRNSQFILMKSDSKIGFIGSAPRFVIEALSIVLFVIFSYTLSQQPGGLINYIPILGALALGAQRMIPAMQQAFSAWASITGCQASLQDAVLLLDQNIPIDMQHTSSDTLSLKKNIKFNNVYFKYDKSNTFVLSGIDFVISKGMCVGFVGKTGSGKSTVMDLILGLLQPTKGEVLVDGISIVGRYGRSWKKSIAHVPQYIYLSDTTLAENIAFGIPCDEIDMRKVEQAAKKAQISDYIMALPRKYQEIVGERGIRLSGGERQRIGIARALYKGAKVVIFDEATSALDNNTEREVMETIKNLSEDMTIILIAHRLTTVKQCDIIFEFSQGKLAAKGKYKDMIKKSKSFKKMVGDL